MQDIFYLMLLLNANPFTGLVLDFEDTDSSLTTAELIRLDKAIYDGEIQKKAQVMFYGGRIGTIKQKSGSFFSLSH